MSGPDVGPFALARESVQGAAKWYIAALGAIGAILLAGSQLSSLGSLNEGSPRFWVAFVGVVVGLLAVLWAVSGVVKILAGRPWTFEDAVRATKKKAVLGKPRPVAKWIIDNPSVLGGYNSLDEIQTTYDGADANDPGLPALIGLMDLIRDKTAAVNLSARFTWLRRQIALAMTVAALGILAFSWAANPDETPAPSLRSANLSGADLRGVSLRGADFTGARLTNANLSGANLEGARIDNVVWANTICPDGSNSDAVARPDKSGRPTGGTCEGHLVP